jgi:hypothetical protein
MLCDHSSQVQVQECCPEGWLYENKGVLIDCCDDGWE